MSVYMTIRKHLQANVNRLRTNKNTTIVIMTSTLCIKLMRCHEVVRNSQPVNTFSRLKNQFVFQNRANLQVGPVCSVYKNSTYIVKN